MTASKGDRVIVTWEKDGTVWKVSSVANTNTEAGFMAHLYRFDETEEHEIDRRSVLTSELLPADTPMVLR